jgi:hypothetical protein
MTRIRARRCGAGAGYAGSKGVRGEFDAATQRHPNGKAVTYAWNFGNPAAGAAETRRPT